MHQMKYLSVVDYCFPDKPGGSGRVAWDVLKALHRRGHEVAALCARQPGSATLLGTDIQDGIKIVRFERPALPSWHPRRLTHNIEAAEAAARQWLAGQGWSTVHIHDPVLGLGVMHAFGDGPRYVTTVHSPIVMEQEINWLSQGFFGRTKLLFGKGMLMKLERDVINNSDAVQVLSAYTKSKLDRYHGVGNRVTVVPHWCKENRIERIGKAEARKRLGWPQDKMIFFSVRQLRPRYGLDIALEAFSSIDSLNEYEYYIAGQGPLRPALERQIEESGLDGCIHLMGRISDNNLELAYQAADIFILPTRALECFGLIILESLAWGCPLIATDAGAIPEVLTRMLPGCVIPAGDVNALREKLLAALEGRLDIPEPDELMARARQIYGENVVFPRIEALLTGSAR